MFHRFIDNRDFLKSMAIEILRNILSVPMLPLFVQLIVFVLMQ